MRVKFPKGKQRLFLNKVLEKMNCPSLRELIRRGFNIPYSTLKNYFNESRTLPLDLFEDLCNFSNFNRDKLDFKILRDYFGQVKGGVISKRESSLNSF